MASGYASNIPLEDVAPEPPILPADACVICKKRRIAADGMCPICTKALAA